MHSPISTVLLPSALRSILGAGSAAPGCLWKRVCQSQEGIAPGPAAGTPTRSGFEEDLGRHGTCTIEDEVHFQATKQFAGHTTNGSRRGRMQHSFYT